MSKAHDMNSSIGTMIVGVLVAYGSSALAGNVFQSAFLIGGIAIFAFGAFLFARGFGLIQTKKANISRQTAAETNTKSNDALNVLDSRFAKGELTEDQYKQMKKDLSE